MIWRATAYLLIALSAVAGRCAVGSTEIDPGGPARLTCGDLTVDLGERVVLLDSGQLGLTHFPDRGVVALDVLPVLRLLVTAKFSTYLVEGPTVQRLQRAREVLEPGEPAEFDNGYAGIGGVYKQADNRLFGFYHAEDHEGLPQLPGGISGFYASVGVAVSSDSGETWTKLGPAITSPKPKSWRAYDGHNGRGAGLPSVVTDPTGRWLLLYYNELSDVLGRGVQVSVARSDLQDGPPIPGRFQKFYAGAFSQPGLGGRDSAVVSALEFDESGAVQPFVVRSDSLDLYVMALNVQSWKEHPALHNPPKRAGDISGVYIATSRDGLAWTTPCRLFRDRSYPEVGKSISWESGIILDPGDDSRGWLVYGYSPQWGHGFPLLAPGTPHFMVGRRISFRIDAAQQGAAATGHGWGGFGSW